MPVTAKDVARELNLSQPTVSRILNGDHRHRASDVTRRRVMDAAQRLGYQPNAVARSLRHGRTNIIGVHTSRIYDVRNDFLGTIVGALQCASGAYELDLMLHSAVHGSPAEVMFGKLRDGRVDGLILHSATEDPLVNLLSQSSLPVVAVADPLPGLPSVTCDDAGGMRALIDVLWDKGYRKFVFLAPRVSLASVVRRQQAFQAYLEARGTAPEDRKIVLIDYEVAAPALPELLRLPGHVAVCCWNDGTAYELLKACKAENVAVPERLAIAGFDGFRDDKLPARQLVTAVCPWEAVATTALKLLVDLISKRSRGNVDRCLCSEEICLPVAISPGDTI